MSYQTTIIIQHAKIHSNNMPLFPRIYFRKLCQKKCHFSIWIPPYMLHRPPKTYMSLCRLSLIIVQCVLESVHSFIHSFMVPIYYMVASSSIQLESSPPKPSSNLRITIIIKSISPPSVHPSSYPSSQQHHQQQHHHP